MKTKILHRILESSNKYEYGDFEINLKALSYFEENMIDIDTFNDIFSDGSENLLNKYKYFVDETEKIDELYNDTYVIKFIFSLDSNNKNNIFDFLEKLSKDMNFDSKYNVKWDVIADIYNWLNVSKDDLSNESIYETLFDDILMSKEGEQSGWIDFMIASIDNNEFENIKKSLNY